MSGPSHIGRRSLCETGEVTDTRQPESRPGAGPFALTAAEIAASTGGRLIHPSDRSVRGAAVDSRQVRPGELFVALPGDRTDGHRFLREAAAAGAAALLVRELPDDMTDLVGPDGPAIIAVPDTLRGLHAVAAAWRTRFSPLVVGVTGSLAKTSTKEAIASILAARFTTVLVAVSHAEADQALAARLLPPSRVVVIENGIEPGAIEKSYFDHVAIFEALSARDPQAATDAIGRHIDRIYATTVNVLADNPKPKKTA